MVDELAVAGTPEECRERIALFEGLVDRIILGGAWVGPSPERLEEHQRVIVETFSPASR
jgi:hypothetical protein